MWKTVAAVAALLGAVATASDVPSPTRAHSLSRPLHVLAARQTQDAGSPLYLDEPSCGYYQCNVTYHPGDNATAHWLDAPEGNVVLDMITHPSDDVGHHVAIVPGTTTNCDNEGQKSCGQFSWIVPTSWAPGNYTLRATSESDPSVESYTDIILVTVDPNNNADVPFRALDPVAGGDSSSSSSASGSAATAGSAPSPTAGESSSAASSSQSSDSSSNDAASQDFAIAQGAALIVALFTAIVAVVL